MYNNGWVQQLCIYPSAGVWVLPLWYVIWHIVYAKVSSTGPCMHLL